MCNDDTSNCYVYLDPGRKRFLGTFPAHAADNSILERRVKQICATIVITDNAEQFTVLPNKGGFHLIKKHGGPCGV